MGDDIEAAAWKDTYGFSRDAGWSTAPGADETIAAKRGEPVSSPARFDTNTCPECPGAMLKAGE